MLMPMKRTRKIVGIVLLALIVVVVAAFLMIDQIARKAVEIGGETAMGVPTTLDKMSLKPFSGKGALEGLTIGNPEGFETPHFMRLGEASAAMDVGSVFKSTVVMNSIELAGLDINLEKRDEGANYEVILDNMKSGEEAPPEEEGGKQFLVERIVVSNITVHADVVVLGKTADRVTLRIPRIELENVGSETGSGVIMSQLMGTIVKSVLVAVVEQGAKVLPKVVVTGVGAGLEKLGGAGKIAVKVVGDVTADVGGKVVNVVGGVAKGIGKLFGGDDEDK